jgi:hypothetical protein
LRCLILALHYFLLRPLAVAVAISLLINTHARIYILCNLVCGLCQRPE